MTVRWLLAALHLVALGVGFAAIWTRARALRGVLDPRAFRRIFAADAAWGLSALLWIGTGLLRAFGGYEKGSAYYLQNHAFWGKMALLVVILLLELWPMVTLVRWRMAFGRGQEVDTRPAAAIARISVVQALLVLAMVFLASAMARGMGQPGQPGQAPVAGPPSAADTGASAGSGTDAPSDAPSDAWVVTMTGVGPVRVGMTVEEARAALGGAMPEPAWYDETRHCGHVALRGEAGAGEGVLAMILDGRVARVEVTGGDVATDRGARVGDAEARIDSLYAPRVSVEPHKYTDGRYLVVTPEHPADSAYRLIFETDGARVTEYRAGVLPAVRFVEGCS